MNKKGPTKTLFLVFIAILILVGGYQILTDKIPVSLSDYHSSKAPENWDEFGEVAYDQLKGTDVFHFGFLYPSDMIGELKIGTSHSYGKSTEIFFDLDHTKQYPFKPSIIITAGPPIIYLLGPIHSLHDFFTSRQDYYGGQENMSKIKNAVIEHISGLNVNNFCDELKSTQFGHAAHLSLPDELKKMVSEKESKFPILENIISCDPRKNAVEIVFTMKTSPEQKLFGIIKFLQKNPYNYTSIQINSTLGQENNISDSEIQKYLWLMAQSFRMESSLTR